MSTRTYKATFEVEVEITVPDDAITRVGEKEWRDTFYRLDERAAVEMIARCCGINGVLLGRLDGWADMPTDRPQSETARITSYDMTDWERVVESTTA